VNSSLATVRSVGNGRATLEIEIQAACPRCAEGKGCGAGLFNGPRERNLQLDVPGDLALSAGDRVYLEVSDSGILRAAVLAYGMPLAGVLLSLALARLVLGPLSDATGVCVAAAGLVTGWILGRRRLSPARSLEPFQPRLVKDDGERRGLSR
jgi:sigma-E factor negative regulatory protein RseC